MRAKSHRASAAFRAISLRRSADNLRVRLERRARSWAGRYLRFTRDRLARRHALRKTYFVDFATALTTLAPYETTPLRHKLQRVPAAFDRPDSENGNHDPPGATA